MRVLIAEDDAHLRDGLATYLSIEGFDCTVAADGLDALDRFRSAGADLCIVDLMLPGMAGLDLCRMIRQEAPEVPIIILTARDAEVDRIAGLELGADDYVSKPFSARELVARMRAVLRRSHKPVGKPTRPPKSSFRIGDLIVDRRALRAHREDQRIELTAREVRILDVLGDRQGEALSRDELFDLCWGRDYFPSSRALDQSISTLRHKIERDPNRPRIVTTVRGIGYRYDGG